jgi:hypothetical protein
LRAVGTTLLTRLAGRRGLFDGLGEALMLQVRSRHKVLLEGLGRGRRAGGSRELLRQNRDRDDRTGDDCEGQFRLRFHEQVLS